MIIKYNQIQSKIKNTSNPIIKIALEICAELIVNKFSEVDLQSLSIEVRNIKTSSGSSYHSTIILGITQGDTSAMDKFDLLEIENNKNFLRSKLTSSWNRLLELYLEMQKVSK